MNKPIARDTTGRIDDAEREFLPDYASREYEAFEAETQTKLQIWWERAGIERPVYPVSTDALVEMLVANEYDVTAELLGQFIQTKQLHIAPPNDAGRWLWDATSICRLLGLLEMQRRWLPRSPIHAHKKSDTVRGLEEARHMGHDAQIESMVAPFSYPLLAALLADSDDKAEREDLYALLMAALQRDGLWNK
jgi:hypothetical protein